MPTRYLVLRSSVPLDESFAYSSPRAWDALNVGAASGPADLAIQAIDGSETDRGALRSDPHNVAVLDCDVVMALIQSTSRAQANVTSLKQVGAHRVPDGLMAVGAHTTPFTGQGVTVAILDTGIDESHPAFQGKIIAKKDFTGEGVNGQDVTDKDGHGTHCAATVCAAPVGQIRVGVAPGVAKLCVGKVLGTRGGTLEMLVRGLLWAVVEEKASVVSMSLSWDLAGNVERLIERGVHAALAAKAVMRQQSDLIKGISTLTAFLESQSPNVVFVAATGNESERPGFVLDAGLPASELFSVGAVGLTGNQWEIAEFSNGRAQIVAPGVDVFSAALGGGWEIRSGTSMATPHLAGIAALWTEKLCHQGVLNIPESVRSAVKSNAVRQSLLTTEIDAIGVGLAQAPQV